MKIFYLRVKDQGRKGKKKNRRVFVNIADLPQNAEYQIGQELLSLLTT